MVFPYLWSETLHGICARIHDPQKALSWTTDSHEEGDSCKKIYGTKKAGVTLNKY